MPFTELPPEWNAPGVEPPQTKKNVGWEATERPPADYWNWQMHRVYMVLQELQQKAAEKSDISGGTNQTVREQIALLLETDTRTTEFVWDAGTLTGVVEKDGATVVEQTTLNYTAGALASIVEAAGGKTVTSTLNRDGSGSLSSITKGVV